MTNIKKITSKKNESKKNVSNVEKSEKVPLTKTSLDGKVPLTKTSLDGKVHSVVDVTESLKDNVNEKPVETINEFLEEYKNIRIVYNKAQEILLTEKRTENDLYIKCLKMTSRAIKFLDELNQFVIQRHKEEIKSV